MITSRCFRIRVLTWIAAGLLLISPLTAANPLKALIVTGGCCHDFEAQKKILSEGIVARANVVFDIVHEGDTREHRVSLYEKTDWAKGYDVVIHNECFGFVDDAAFIERIVSPHVAGVPAVVLHCSSHSYRNTTTDAWRQLVGITSVRHERRHDMLIEKVNTEHPVMAGFPPTWFDAQDELYLNVKVWPNVVPLATSTGQEGPAPQVVVWTNTHGKARVFATTLGHSNSTMSDPVYLDLVARGLLWSVGQLDHKGSPKPGYGPAGK
jgi:type 1 glutamine amidotransferase